MNDTLVFILSLSIGFAAILGAVRFNQMDKSYYPFIFSIWTSLFVEITVRILTLNGLATAISIFYNIYYLVDFYLFFWLFDNWKLFGHSKRRSSLIKIVAVLVWIVTTFLAGGIQAGNTYFPILYSFALVFFSVTTFNKFIVNERGNILKNARFWICLGLIIFYTFFIVTNSAITAVFNVQLSINLRHNVHEIGVYTNFLVNLMYAIAVLCIPRKKNFTSLF